MHEMNTVLMMYTVGQNKILHTEVVGKMAKKKQKNYEPCNIEAIIYL